MKVMKYFNEFLNEESNKGYIEYSEAPNHTTDVQNFIVITTPIGSQDFELFREVVNKGIDSHLEAFTKSVFKQEGNRYHFKFHKSEKEILLRRLQEMADATENEEIERWISDIENYDEMTKD